jgi:hypothetical protein
MPGQPHAHVQSLLMMNDMQCMDECEALSTESYPPRQAAQDAGNQLLASATAIVPTVLVVASPGIMGLGVDC